MDSFKFSPWIFGKKIGCFVKNPEETTIGRVHSIFLLWVQVVFKMQVSYTVGSYMVRFFILVTAHVSWSSYKHKHCHRMVIASHSVNFFWVGVIDVDIQFFFLVFHDFLAAKTNQFHFTRKQKFESNSLRSCRNYRLEI